jgi:hypothetical protein
MVMKHVGIWAAVAGLLLTAAPAAASPYKFTITGDYSASFILDSDAIPGGAQSGTGMVFYDTAGFPDASFGVADVYFWNAAIGGGLEIDDFYSGTTLVTTDGPQVYSQDENTPHFLLGTYSMTQYQGTGTYSLTISDPNAVAPAPEAATWTMMLAGFGLTGGAMRRRRVAVAFKHA